MISAVKDFNNFSDFNVQTRAILMKNPQAALTTLTQIAQVAQSAPTTAELLRTIERPMKQTSDEIKSNWIA